MIKKEEIQDFLGITIHKGAVDYEIITSEDIGKYKRQLIKYSGSESDEIHAYLFIPHAQIIGSVLVHHQHNGERHLGKSEVAGRIGDPYQAFCPALAEKGILALAPDSICFEDRRRNTAGTDPSPNPDDDWLQHYNEMAYRLLQGKTLMKKVIEDSAIAISLLAQIGEDKNQKIGILGHSYGGNTVIFHAPFDDRIKYSCSSGAVCSYQTKFENETGIELAEVIPGFVEKYEISDLLKCITPRKLLILSASEDRYAQDAEDVYNLVKQSYEESGVGSQLSFKKYHGEHPLTEERFNFIIDWFTREMRKQNNH